MDLPGNYLANVAALDSRKGIFIGIARFALGSGVLLVSQTPGPTC